MIVPKTTTEVAEESFSKTLTGTNGPPAKSDLRDGETKCGVFVFLRASWISCCTECKWKNIINQRAHVILKKSLLASFLRSLLKRASPKLGDQGILHRENKICGLRLQKNFLEIFIGFALKEVSTLVNSGWPGWIEAIVTMLFDWRDFRRYDIFWSSRHANHVWAFVLQSSCWKQACNSTVDHGSMGRKDKSCSTTKQETFGK